MGIGEILLISFISSLIVGFTTVEYQKAREDKPPFKSEAPADGSIYFKPEIKINGKRSDV